MDDKLLKPYDPKNTEPRIYKLWEESGFFNPDNLPSEENKTFTIMMPPPNATGVLHMGHAMMLTLEDIMIRYKRMQGFKALWLPGTDHAAIATQSKVEKDISKKEGKSRHDLGREELLKRIGEFVEESRSTITKQTRVMGASCDWSREAFTLDEKRNLAVKTVFKKMYENGIIYRGHRIVNWDPKGQTTISDDEIVYQEEKTKFYYLKYGPFTIGTARPETKFGDKYVVMHPKDERYAKYTHGQKIDLEWINGPITATVIKDESIDTEFGTGVMTITPWHSMADFEIAERHKLDREQIIDERGKLLPIGGEFAGMKITEARARIVEKLKEKGLLEKEEDYTHNIATAERTGGIIEPQIKLQWFVNVNKPIADRGNKTLKQLMREPLENKDIKIIPEYFDKTYFHWIDNLRDWCISRQIWYGHRIPVWYDEQGDVHLPKEQKVIFARHGESVATKNGLVAGGGLDSPLTEEGIDQIKVLAEKLKDKNIVKIICSNLSRGKDTAQIIAEKLGISKIEFWEELHEIDVGNLTNTPVNLLNGKTAFEKAIETGTGETLEELTLRAQGVLSKLKLLEENGTVLIIAHNAFLAVIDSVRKGIPKEKYFEHRENRGILAGGQMETWVFLNDPKEKGLRQDEDTLDTWFSSSLWTFSTLGWPEQTKDLEMYHPTDVLETGYEILFFWVARMILMTKYVLNEVPFHTIYLHGTVRDGQGRKMSKSLGNGVDPIYIAEKYGADAARMALIVGTAPGTDSRISEDKIKGYKNFANKIWNITRFITTYSNSPMASLDYIELPFVQEDKKIWDEFNSLIKDITKEMDEHKFHIVAEKIYHYIWHEFADKIIEESKSIITQAPQINQRVELSRQLLLREIFKSSLRLLHPFMPFVTEEIWSMLPIKDKKLLIIEKWPS